MEAKAMTKLRITADSELATPEAIQFRIDQLRGELSNGASTTDKLCLSRRIAYLKTRLPQQAGAAIVPPISAELLLTKGELERGYKLNIVEVF
jgi:hypothetical protein